MKPVKIKENTWVNLDQICSIHIKNDGGPVVVISLTSTNIRPISARGVYGLMLLNAIGDKEMIDKFKAL
jgi:hypothetical protein